MEALRQYVAIDLKSFYASVECVDRGLDPLNTLLLVADSSRTEKTICLAVSPALKKLGIPGRARLFEAVQKVRAANEARRRAAPGYRFTGKSHFADELEKNPALEAEFLIAPPRMGRYMTFSTDIYRIYLKYVSPDDIHVYSIDEVFIDVTDYLALYKTTARELAMRMIRDVLHTTGVTATAGIGTNLFLCKVAMDIKAKHMTPDADGVRIAELDEASFRREFWDHRPLTDFWRVGPGIARRLERQGMFTMGDVARCSVEDEEILYDLFGVNAELLIDHAWGWEPCRISDIKNYRSETKSISAGQVLQRGYTNAQGRLVVREMTDSLVLDLVEQNLLTPRMTLTVEYDAFNQADSPAREEFRGQVTTDRYGRELPKPAHGTVRLKKYTSSTRRILEAVTALYDRITDKTLKVRKIYVVAEEVRPAAGVSAAERTETEEMDIFCDAEAVERKIRKEEAEEAREKDVQKAILEIRKKYGKNAMIKGMNLEKDATERERNGRIGGHKA